MGTWLQMATDGYRWLQTIPCATAGHQDELWVPSDLEGIEAMNQKLVYAGAVRCYPIVFLPESPNLVQSSSSGHENHETAQVRPSSHLDHHTHRLSPSPQRQLP